MLTVIWSAVIKFLTSKTGLILIAALLVVGAFYGYGWSRYNEGKEEVSIEFRAYRLETEAAWKVYNDEVERQKSEIAKLKAAKTEAILEAQRKFAREHSKRVEARLATQRRIDEELKPNSYSVVAPSGIWMRYNDSVYSYGYSDQERADNDARNSGRDATASTSLEANSTAHILVDNVESYNELAERHNALVNLIKEIERRNANATGN